MIAIKWGEPYFKRKEEGGKHYIFDGIRKTWLLLTEEEWVRQNFVAYIINELHYPAALIALEKMLILNDLKKRFDILVYDAEHKPWMLVECKAPLIKLSEDVLQQVLRYNISIPVTYIIITNGEHTIGWRKEQNGLTLINEMPFGN
ncbi:MAG TPA: type I restriction enzyme HsdR N-terminal domain-containing protein, partial [Chitinophagaceae bacterium]|nr:type I restriction enzyme HsdR N-terminal domain-containing protein [Chitinophagaceae bacterium]